MSKGISKRALQYYIRDYVTSPDVRDYSDCFNGGVGFDVGAVYELTNDPSVEQFEDLSPEQVNYLTKIVKSSIRDAIRGKEYTMLVANTVQYQSFAAKGLEDLGFICVGPYKRPCAGSNVIKTWVLTGDKLEALK